MDFVRTFFRTEMRLWGPDQPPVPVRWHRVCCDAQVFQGPHAFHNVDWQQDKDDRGPFGLLGVRGAYDKGGAPAHYRGDSPHGASVVFREGGVVGVDEPLTTDADGALPDCVLPVEQASGGVAFGGTTEQGECPPAPIVEVDHTAVTGFGGVSFGGGLLTIPEGDLLLVMVWTPNTVTSITPPSEFTELASGVEASPGRRWWLGYFLLDDDYSTAFTWSTSSPFVVCEAMIYWYRGAGVPTFEGYQDGTSSTVSWPAVTITDADSVVCGLMPFAQAVSTTSLVTPTVQTLYGGPGQPDVYIWESDPLPAGSAGGWSFTCTASGLTHWWTFACIVPPA